MSETIEGECKECEADNCLCTCHLNSGETVRFSNEDLTLFLIKINEFIASGELIALIPEGVDVKDFNKGVSMLPALISDLQDSRTENLMLRNALHDAINKPKGVVPQSAEPFYDTDGFYPTSMKEQGAFMQLRADPTAPLGEIYTAANRAGYIVEFKKVKVDDD